MNLQQIHKKRERNTCLLLKKNQTTTEETERRKKNYHYKNYQKTINKMAKSTYLSMTMLNVNEINAIVRSHRMVCWIKKPDPPIYYLQETHFRVKRHIHRLKVGGWKIFFHTIGNVKK